ncbi:MAG: hypothetical protein ACI4HI_06055 [Lachnospiraceae bacterium]
MNFQESETDGDHFEEMRSLEQTLTFETVKKNSPTETSLLETHK